MISIMPYKDDSDGSLSIVMHNITIYENDSLQEVVEKEYDELSYVTDKFGDII